MHRQINRKREKDELKQAKNKLKVVGKWIKQIERQTERSRMVN